MTGASAAAEPAQGRALVLEGRRRGTPSSRLVRLGRGTGHLPAQTVLPHQAPGALSGEVPRPHGPVGGRARIGSKVCPSSF